MMRSERDGTGWRWPKGAPNANGSTGTLFRDDTKRVEELTASVHQRLLDELDTRRLETLPEEHRRPAVEAAARTLLSQAAPDIAGLAQDSIVAVIVDEVLGLGPIETLIQNPEITEVMVNSPDQVFVEKEGRLTPAGVKFRDATHIMRIVERIVAPIGRRVDESSPMVDARLPDGSRVNITIPPVSPRAPSITIRKFRSDRLKMEDLVKIGSMTEGLAYFLESCVKIKLNTLVSGGTGTGKTTILNALSAYIPDGERIVTIEDPAELKLQREHVVTLEARPPSLEGRGEITQRDLVRNALRMRPDRIIVGEVRGGEAFDMLQAMNTGHEGSLTTVHANTPRDALARVENMVLMAGLELPVRAIREQVSSAIHLIVQISRFSDGTRKVTEVTEVSGMEGQTITLQEIFKFHQTGIDPDGKVLGGLQPTGIRPSFADRFATAGINMPPTVFLNNASGTW
jgi:pilus assembly protein CpaF